MSVETQGFNVFFNSGQERDPPPPLKPLKVEPEDILDTDDYSSAERRKSCKFAS